MLSPSVLFFDCLIHIDITVSPKKGKALLWPGVLNQFPMTIDDRTRHEARPVIKGIKYAANTW